MRRPAPWLVAALAVFAIACTDDPNAPSTRTESTRAPDAPSLAVIQGGGPTGAIFTTTPDGGIVNENVHYQSKDFVYLDGGPRNNAPAHAAGLDEGYYVFQITDPPGHMLLSRDPARCRVVHVNAAGVIDRWVPPTQVPGLGATTNNWADGGANSSEPCQIQAAPNATQDAGPGDAAIGGRHDENRDDDHFDVGARVVQMMPYGTTPNPGGVYKAWVQKLDAYVARDGELNDVPRQLPAGKQRPHACPDFCAAADPAFAGSRSLMKTDNFKVREAPPQLIVRKYEDVNGNGSLDTPPDEEITGWPIVITEEVEGDPVVHNLFTPDVFDAAFDSDLEICEAIPDDWAFSFVRVIVDGTVHTVTVTDGCFDFHVPASGVREIVVIFGNFELGTKSGLKFHDLNADGDQDTGEAGLAGWSMKLLDAANAVVATTTTNADGEYTFTDLAAGAYKVCEVQQPSGTPPPVWYQSAPHAGTVLPAGETLVDCDAINAAYGPNGYGFSISTSGQQRTDNDFGNYQNATKTGVKFHDLNGDGIKGATEPLLANWEIRAYDGTTQEASDLTDQYGVYSLSLKPGSYTVCEVLKAAWYQSYPTGTDCQGVAAGLGAAGYAITLTSGQVDAGNDFGNYQNASLSGIKFSDIDGSGTRNTGDGVLANFEIHLFGTTGLGQPHHDHDVTDANGAYSFANVPPGLYNLCEVQREGFLQRFPTLGPPATPNAIDCTALAHPAGGGGLGAPSGVGYSVALTSGASVTANFDFGNEPTAGCTPGFWQGGNGNVLWNTLNDPDWPARGGNGTNPFAHGTLFKDGPWNDPSEVWLQNMTMLQIVGTGGTEEQARKAARSLIAAYLNSSFGIAYAYTPAQLVSMWNTANAGGGPQRLQRLLDLHTLLDRANNRGCTIPGTPIY